MEKQTKERRKDKYEWPLLRERERERAEENMR
jgi:hypothetical protein